MEAPRLLLYKMFIKKTGQRGIFSQFLYLCFILLLLEVFSRCFLMVTAATPFFKPSEIIFQYYPELEMFEYKRDDRQKHYDILFLGASTINDGWSNIRKMLMRQLKDSLGVQVRVFNMARIAESSLDDYYKYRYLKNKKFDLVLFYDGFNELRANNCPPDIFRDDYSHYSWYEEINTIEAHPEIDYLAFPYLLHRLSIGIWRSFSHTAYVPRHNPNEQWVKYGCDIKTAEPFRENLSKILTLADQKSEAVLLQTVAFYVPQDYSLSRFREKTLDYGRHITPIEMWGDPVCVIKGIKVHNQVVRDLSTRPGVIFVDQEKLIPKKGIYFEDVCHLTEKGAQNFVDHILGIIVQQYHSSK